MICPVPCRAWRFGRLNEPRGHKLTPISDKSAASIPLPPASVREPLASDGRQLQTARLELAEVSSQLNGAPKNVMPTTERGSETIAQSPSSPVKFTFGQ